MWKRIPNLMQQHETPRKGTLQLIYQNWLPEIENVILKKNKVGEHSD